jgi:hypothetical protein
LVRSEIHQLEIVVAKILEKGEGGGAALAAQCEAVRDKFTHALFSPAKDSVLSRYVQFHQAGITALSNKLFRQLTQANNSADAVILALESLNDFLKEKFYRFFDLDHPISAWRWHREVQEMTRQQASLEHLLSTSAIDPALAAAITTAFANKVKDSYQIMPGFRHVENHLFLLRAIISWLSTNTDLSTELLALELYRLNFNSYYFIQWYQDNILEKLEDVTDQKRPIIILNAHKRLKSVYVERERLFETDQLPIDEQLLSWFRSLLPGRPEVGAGNSIHGRERMPLQLSVHQFALFIRLCYLEGCFPVHNISASLRFFTANFETKKQQHISVKSFARAFYSADQSTAAVVRDFLQRMINFIDKTYFPN